MRGVLKPREERIGGDAYFTPPELAEAICYRIGCKLEPRFVLEPSAGAGAFMRGARKRWASARVVGIDVTPQAEEIEECNFLLPGTLPGGGVADLILGNPPYLLAEQFVESGLTRLNHGGHLAYLLRLSFLGGQGRADRIWSRRELRWLFPIIPRPSFTPDGKTDASEYALFVWERGYSGNAEILAPLKWERSRRGPEPKQQGLGFTTVEAPQALSNRGRAAKPEEAA